MIKLKLKYIGFGVDCFLTQENTNEGMEDPVFVRSISVRDGGDYIKTIYSILHDKNKALLNLKHKHSFIRALSKIRLKEKQIKKEYKDANTEIYWFTQKKVYEYER